MKKCLILFLFLLSALSMSAQEQPVRLLYWNIQNGMWDGQTDDYQRFINWVSKQQADICVWCEAMKNYKTESDKHESESEKACLTRWKKLAARYGHQYVYMGGCRDNYPQVITSRYPVTVEKRITGNRDTTVYHGSGWFSIELNGKKINIVTLHTWPQRWGPKVSKDHREQSATAHEGDQTRRREMEYICRNTILTQPHAKDEDWMMMGDFNAISPLDNEHYRMPADTSAFWVHSYVLHHTPYRDLMRECFPDEFIPSEGFSKRRIDFVYLTPLLLQRVVKAYTAWDYYTAPLRSPKQLSNFYHPSDHVPIIVDFAI